MTLRLTSDPRPLTDRELVRLNDYLADGIALHLDQQRALVAEIAGLRRAAGAERACGAGLLIDGPL